MLDFIKMALLDRPLSSRCSFFFKRHFNGSFSVYTLRVGALTSISKMFHVTHEIKGEHFMVKEEGKWHITPLFFALLIIETMDVIFAFDSIPAIFLVTQDVFIVYTSNIFAILGLRALYFLLAAIVNKFSYLKPALSIILIFIGLKIFAPHFGFEIQTWQSLCFTMLMLTGGILLSVFKEKSSLENPS